MRFTRFALTATLTLAASASAGEIADRSWIGHEIPEFSTRDGAWFNTDGPVSIAKYGRGATLVVYSALW